MLGKSAVSKTSVDDYNHLGTIHYIALHCIALHYIYTYIYIYIINVDHYAFWTNPSCTDETNHLEFLARGRCHHCSLLPAFTVLCLSICCTCCAMIGRCPWDLYPSCNGTLMKIDDHGIFVFSPIIFRQSHGVPWKWDLWVTFFEVLEHLQRFAKSWRIAQEKHWTFEPLNEFLFPVKPCFLVHSTGCRRGFGNWKVVARSSWESCWRATSWRWETNWCLGSQSHMLRETLCGVLRCLEASTWAYGSV